MIWELASTYLGLLCNCRVRFSVVFGGMFLINGLKWPEITSVQIFTYDSFNFIRRYVIFAFTVEPT
jgi:hypothetical protein